MYIRPSTRMGDAVRATVVLHLQTTCVAVTSLCPSRRIANSSGLLRPLMMTARPNPRIVPVDGFGSYAEHRPRAVDSET